MKPKNTFNKVKKLVLERVQQAVDSGKVLEVGSWAVNLRGQRTSVCAVGAFALNGGECTSNWLKYNDVYTITAPLLMACGVEEDEVGIILDSLSAGFEDEDYENALAWSYESKALGSTSSIDPEADPGEFAIPTEYMCYYNLGKEIYGEYC